MMKSEFVFAYGSNMDPSQMKERCPESDLSWFVAKLEGYRLSFPRKSKKRKGGVGSVVRDPEQSVWGVVFAVSDRDLLRLDEYEGVTRQKYQRRPVRVVDREPRVYEVWTYVALPHDTPAQHYAPHKEYIQLYIKGAEYFGLPAEYIEGLKKIAKEALSSAG